MSRLADPVLVLVTAPEYRKAADVFNAAVAHGLVCRSAPSEEAALAELVRASGAGAVVLGTERYSGALYEALPVGGVIARFGVGFDGVDLTRATSRGLLCTNTPGVLDLSVAEHAIGLMLAAARHIAATDRAMRANDWAPRVGVELCGRRLAVIGCGSIGRRVASIATRGFGMEVVGCDRSVSGDFPEIDEPFSRRVPTFERAVEGADFVSLHIPATPANRHFINRELLRAMARGAWLINTARGPIVDEAALIAALQRGGIAGAALDVFEVEPLPLTSPLLTMDNVMLAPHNANSSPAAWERVHQNTLNNLLIGLNLA